MKKLALILAVLLALSGVALAHAEEALTCGDFGYTLQEDGTAVITKYSGSTTALEIPAELDGHPVAAIGDYGFMFCLGLRSVTLPEGVQRIGAGAFSMCYYLSEIILPEGVVSIGENVFWDCASLYRVAIPASVTDIHEKAFASCPELTLLVAPGSYAEQYAAEMNMPCELIDPAA